LNEIQTLILESIARNREHYNLSLCNNNNLLNGVSNTDDKEDEIEDLNDVLIEGVSNPKIDLNNGNKESCVLLEVDDTEDADIISLMIDSEVPKGYEICNSERLPGMSNQLVCNLQMFSQVYRAKLTSLKQFGHQFDWVIQVCVHPLIIIINSTPNFLFIFWFLILFSESFCQISSTHSLLFN
jgi:hypothetical protein